MHRCMCCMSGNIWRFFKMRCLNTTTKRQTATLLELTSSERTVREKKDSHHAFHDSWNISTGCVAAILVSCGQLSAFTFCGCHLSRPPFFARRALAISSTACMYWVHSTKCAPSTWNDMYTLFTVCNTCYKSGLHLDAEVTENEPIC